MPFPEPSLWWLGYATIGAFVGTFAGMLGVGGGMMIIPLLALSLDGQGVPREHVLHVAVGTAMATIAFTSLSSMRAHASRKAVRWEIARRMTPGILLGGLIGSQLARLMSTRALAVYFAVFVFVMAINMALDLKPKPRPGGEQLGAPAMFAAGFLISGVSALLAMGGAVLTIPLMLYMQVPMIQAIGTAAAIGFPIAVGGTAGYMTTGWGNSGLPPWSIGYVYLPALVGITAASVLTAPLGARIAHRLPARTLRLIFATLLFVLAARMLYSLW